MGEIMQVRPLGLMKATLFSLLVAGLLHRLLPLLRKRGIIRHDLALPHEDDILEAKYMGLCASTTSNKLRRIGESAYDAIALAEHQLILPLQTS